jgi:hypothetical protein
VQLPCVAIPLALAGAALALVYGRARLYEKVLACPRGSAVRASFEGLCCGVACGLLVGMCLARGLGAATWWALLAGLAAAVGADVWSGIRWVRQRGLERGAAVPLVWGTLARWLVAAGLVTVALGLAVLVVVWLTVVTSYP